MQEGNTTNPLNQPVNNSVPVVEQPKQSNFLAILLSVLLFLSVFIAGFFAFQTQKLVKELTLLRSEPTPVATTESTTEPVATNSAIATSDPTANWKTYAGMFFSFKYPSNWTKNGEFELKGQNPNIRIVVAEEGSIMNECMQQGQSDMRNGFVVKNFTRVNTGEMCSGGDATKLESWVVKDVNSYGPGIQIFYNSGEPANQLPNAIISNILSTFKFTN